MPRLSGMVLGLVLAAAGFAQAQEVIKETQTTTVPGTAVPPEMRRVSQILGSTVRLEGNNNFGTVNDIVLDQDGRIDYLVVATGDRYAMLPWSAGTMNYTERFVAYPVALPAIQPLFFRTSAWPNVYDQQYTARVRRIFPNRAVRREVLRPVPGAAPAPAPAPRGDVKVRVKPNGDVKIKERVK